MHGHMNLKFDACDLRHYVLYAPCFRDLDRQGIICFLGQCWEKQMALWVSEYWFNSD